MNRKLVPASLLACAVVLAQAGPGAAGSCGYPYCWGAVAIGPGGAYGFSHSWASEQQAYDSAQTGCEWDCTVVQTFYNSCAAIAVADNGGWGWGYDSTRYAAESRAMSYCAEQGYNCRVRVWSCSQ
jgi:hypothetical protein